MGGELSFRPEQVNDCSAPIVVKKSSIFIFDLVQIDMQRTDH